MMEMPPQYEHERYEGLCALATAGVLTPEESELLTAHLGDCAECREAFAQYQSIATDGMSFLAGHYAAISSEVPFDESSALARLMQAADGVGQQATRLAVMPNKKSVWKQAWVRGLVAASLIAAVGAGAFRTGAHSADTHLHGVSMELQSSLERTLTEKQAEKKALENMIQADKVRIAALEQRSVTDKNEMAKLRAEAETATQQLAGMTDAMNAAKKESDVQLAALTEERDVNGNKLRDAEKISCERSITSLKSVVQIRGPNRTSRRIANPTSRPSGETIRMCRLAVVIFFLLFWASHVFAQTGNASLTGFIQDTSKAFIPDVRVLAINTDTNQQLEATTKKDGSYNIASLPVGPYRMQVEKVGFRTILKENLFLHTQDVLQINYQWI